VAGFEPARPLVANAVSRNPCIGLKSIGRVRRNPLWFWMYRSSVSYPFDTLDTLDTMGLSLMFSKGLQKIQGFDIV
jgi:hypothetical protein